MDYQVMPNLSGDEYEELKADIAERGVMVPIEFDEAGNVLDGHHRLRVCEELGIKEYPKVIRVGLSEEDKRLHARKLNMARRHLTQEQRREMIKRQLLETPEKSDRQISAGLGVDRRTVDRIREQMVDNIELGHCPSSIGADGKTRPRPQKPVSIFNPKPNEERALRQPEIISKLTNDVKTVADAIRETKREEIINKLENIQSVEAKTAQGVYDVIIIDPPWDMQKIERDERPNQVELDYPTMTEDELQQLKIPAADDCHLWLWTTQKYLPMALRLLEVWGFNYVCTFIWHKPGGFQPIGLPQYNAEFAIYARKGTPQFIDTKAFPLCFNAPRGNHSEKPEEFYEMIRRVTAGRRIDMFNRRAIKGFDRWGNEVMD